MNSVKILHTADIHIGARDAFLGVNAESRRFETLLTFEKIVDLAREKGVQILAIAGDLFDQNGIEAEFVTTETSVTAYFAHGGILYRLNIAGNHEEAAAILTEMISTMK